MEALERLENIIYGDPSTDRRGVVERVNAVERDVSEIRSGMTKIIWLLVAGVIGAVLNLVLNAKNLAATHYAAPAGGPQITGKP